MSKPLPPSLSPPKTVLVFCLEDVLIPSNTVPDLEMKKVHTLLSSIQKYQKKSPSLRAYLVSGYQEEIAWKKIREFGLEKFFPRDHVWAVNPEYLGKMEEVDRKLYEGRCAQDEECRDEYFKQVQLKSLIASEKLAPSSILLVGHDYWFDGFYTRRFSGVDIAFIESALTSRGKPISEKIPGVWYIERDWKSVKRIIEGKMPAPHYAPLDTWISITLTGELLGPKGIPQLKRVILERKKGGKGFDAVQKQEPPPKYT